MITDNSSNSVSPCFFPIALLSVLILPKMKQRKEVLTLGTEDESSEDVSSPLQGEETVLKDGRLPGGKLYAFLVLITILVIHCNRACNIIVDLIDILSCCIHVVRH